MSDGACAFGVAKAHTERKALRVADSAEIGELETGLEVKTYGHEEGSPTAAPASNAVSNRVTPKCSSSGSGIRDWHSTNALAVSTCVAASTQASNRPGADPASQCPGTEPASTTAPQAPTRPRAETANLSQEQGGGESCSNLATTVNSLLEEAACLLEAVPRDDTSMLAEGESSVPELALHGCDAATVAPVEVSAGSADIQCSTVPSMVSSFMARIGLRRSTLGMRVPDGVI